MRDGVPSSGGQSLEPRQWSSGGEQSGVCPRGRAACSSLAWLAVIPDDEAMAAVEGRELIGARTPRSPMGGGAPSSGGRIASLRQWSSGASQGGLARGGRGSPRPSGAEGERER